MTYGRTVYCTLILTQNGPKKAWPPLKIPQNDEHIIIQQTV
jgi:hypothetical protein